MNLLRLAKAIGIVARGGVALLGTVSGIVILLLNGIFWPVFGLFGAMILYLVGLLIGAIYDDLGEKNQ